MPSAKPVFPVLALTRCDPGYGRMSRVENIGRATLYLGDCRDILRGLPKVDAVITDPPFVGLSGDVVLKSGSAVGVDAGHATVGDEWDADYGWLQDAWAICDLGLITFCTYHSVGEFPASLGKPVGLSMWNKPNAPWPARNVPRASAELIWFFQKNPGLNWRAIDGSVFEHPKLSTGCMASPERVLIPGTGKAAHPAQKPVAVMDWIMGVMSEIKDEDGWSVCDPFMGTGTTGLSALKAGGHFFGIERDPEHFETACRRIAEVQGAAGPLFGEAA